MYTMEMKIQDERMEAADYINYPKQAQQGLFFYGK